MIFRMEVKSEKRNIAGDDIEYLHINDETAINPSCQSRTIVSELWKLSLLKLYGGSKVQRYLHFFLSFIQAILNFKNYYII